MGHEAKCRSPDAPHRHPIASPEALPQVPGRPRRAVAGRQQQLQHQFAHGRRKRQRADASHGHQLRPRHGAGQLLREVAHRRGGQEQRGPSSRDPARRPVSRAGSTAPHAIWGRSWCRHLYQATGSLFDSANASRFSRRGSSGLRDRETRLSLRHRGTSRPSAPSPDTGTRPQLTQN